MIENRLVRSFGRIKSRKLSDNKQDLYDNLLPVYEFDLNDDVFLNKKDLILEIGFGFGDFTFPLAKNSPNSNIIAGEIHVNGVVNLLSMLKNDPQDNLRIYKSDIRLFLQEVPDNIFDKIYILFPDPWPKSKHYKRRLINNEFLDLVKTKMKPKAEFIIATDHDSYKEWIMSVMMGRDDFFWQAQKESDWSFPDDWEVTKYQKKALREGRNSVYLKFLRV